LLRLLEGDNKLSRTADTTNAREGENEMNVCQFCGWEVRQPDWYNYYNQKPICDDCNMDISLEREKERASQ
jgi:hypothetical protein